MFGDLGADARRASRERVGSPAGRVVVWERIQRAVAEAARARSSRPQARRRAATSTRNRAMRMAIGGPRRVARRCRGGGLRG